MRLVDPVIPHPALWIGAELDAFLPPAGAEGMEQIVPALEKAIVADCGHWVMWEQPEILNRLMLDWLQRKFPANAQII
jgi:pimeloyl-ACP methyl ester carboxylesterase